jgi:drug/metabolite transporter (DMT)-like permease
VPGDPALETTGLTVLAMVAFAANSLLCRAALAAGHVDAVSFTTIRLMSGALALGLLVRVRDRQPSANTTPWGSAAALFAYAIAFSLAYVRISTGIGALLLFTAVQLTMIGSALRAGERPPSLEWIGLALSIAGLVALTRPGFMRPDPVGALLMLAAGVAWGVYSLRGRQVGDAVATNAGGFAYAVPLTLVASALAVLTGAIHLTTTGVVLALASGAVTSGLGYAVWYAALGGLTATRAAIVQLSVPPLAAIGGVIFLGEAVTTRLVIASLLILGGIALVTLGRQRT